MRKHSLVLNLSKHGLSDPSALRQAEGGVANED